MIHWLLGLLKTRSWRFAGIAFGTAIAIALLAELGAFVQSSGATMTARAIRTVGVDWQVELVPGASADAVTKQVAESAQLKGSETVGYGSVDAFEFTDTQGTQTTGAGQVVGLSASYYDTYPAGFRMLAGDTSGAVLLQQTAANLHAAPGDEVTVKLADGRTASIHISGIVDLKNADPFFQAVGVPPGAAPQAPPDNAAMLPIDTWRQIFRPLQTSRPDAVREQLHVKLAHDTLPTAPEQAYVDALGAGHNFEVRAAGTALLANNLAAQLDATRADALYARVLFLFLGAPGVVLAALLTVSVAGAGAERRRRDLSLLRLRGATRARIIGLSALEGIAAGVAGVVFAMLLIVLANPLFGLPALNSSALVWWAGSALAGLLLATAAVTVPAIMSSREMTVVAARQTLAPDVAPLWERLFIDVICLGLAGLIFWQTAATGYQVVLATEGVAAIAVDYAAFLAPLLLWLGAALLTIRVVRLVLGHGRAVIGWLTRPFAGSISPAVTSAMARQRRRIATGTAFAAMAIAFAVSTSIFNTTYQGQARVDALLTSGADVTVRGTTIGPVNGLKDALRKLPGVADLSLMQHRFAYVGTDLQDLYGIDATTIQNATTLSDAYFQNSTTDAALTLLKATPNAALVSDETAKDFQLTLGDTLNLRLQGKDGQYRPVSFSFAGVVREFPTAPRDSFIVTNAAYVAQQTGLPQYEYALLRTNGDRNAVKAAAASLVALLPGAQVSTLDEATHVIGSSLTSVDLDGLTRLELGFAILLAVGATGLSFALGLADRRRSFAILTGIGASPAQLAAFIIAEGVVTLLGAGLFGAAAGWLVAEVLVLVLQGVFDPPPEALSYPAGYLIALVAAVLIATGLSLWNGIRESRIEPVRRLRELQ